LGRDREGDGDSSGQVVSEGHWKELAFGEGFRLFDGGQEGVRLAVDREADGDALVFHGDRESGIGDRVTGPWALGRW